MFLDGVIRNDPEDIANLFNQHFFAQFSEESSYEIDIDFSDDPFLDFTFNETSIFNLLKQTNPNKSQGPDSIGGYLLKNCAHSISSPLVIIFNISFHTGSIPTEWKTANIVPIHKKGDKNCIKTITQFL